MMSSVPKKADKLKSLSLLLINNPACYVSCEKKTGTKIVHL